ncbi:MAG TPA: RNA polymerase sigma factor RpoD/SigA [Chthonomonadales bacterium]|nr:RNA polymerase sigma factor RpoD/SigA [Chthonomonadales bacterium]
MHRLTSHRLLSSQEEVLLARKAREGNQAAKALLVEANMRLVTTIARQYPGHSLPFEDLVQEGAIGLMSACDRYDPDRGFRFSTYATHWIRQAISRALDNKARAIRVPAHVSEAQRKVEREREACLRENGEEPTIELLAERLHTTVRRLQALLRAVESPISLDMLVGEQDVTALANLVNDPSALDPQDELMRSEMARQLHEIVNALSERERTVMQRRLGLDGGEPQVLRDIGAELRISRERVRQIEAQALKHLRAMASRRRLAEYLAD